MCDVPFMGSRTRARMRVGIEQELLASFAGELRLTSHPLAAPNLRWNSSTSASPPASTSLPTMG